MDYIETSYVFCFVLNHLYRNVSIGGLKAARDLWRKLQKAKAPGPDRKVFRWMIDLLDVWVAKTPRRVFVGAGIQQVGEGRSSLDTCEGRQTPGVHQVGTDECTQM